MKASFAYQQNPDQAFLSKVKGQYGSRYSSMGLEIYRNFSTDYFSFYESGTVAKFDGYRAPNVFHEISLVFSAAKILNLVSEINPEFTNVNPTQSIHVEITTIAFGDHTGGSIKLVTGYNKVQYGGFRVDEFSVIL